MQGKKSLKDPKKQLQILREAGRERDEHTDAERERNREKERQRDLEGGRDIGTLSED